MSSQDLSTGLLCGHHIKVILGQQLMLVFPECLSNGTCVPLTITLLVFFSTCIYQDLIGDDFQLPFHTLTYDLPIFFLALVKR